MARVTYNILVFASIFILEWYFFLGVLIIGIFLFDEFYEGIIYALLFDLTYGSTKPDIFYMRYILSTSFVLVILVGEKLKKYLRYYPEHV